MSSVAITVDDKTRQHIDTLVHMTGKPKETVLREVVETGLKSYTATPSKSVEAVLDLFAWVEKEHITGQARDLSTNHNTYAWQNE